VRLPSGGALVIDPTEALISIDVNSARANKGGDIEETALNTNLEAAEEIARQLRLRDLGGLVVIDFIDMGPSRHQRDVENRLREHLKADRARVQVGRISRFGLLEMSRQRLRPALGEAHQEICPRCAGLGHVRGVESLGLAVLRLIEEEATKDRITQLIVQLPVAVATFILNDKRMQIEAIEQRHTVKVVLIPNPHLETPHYDIERIKDGNVRSEVSHQLMTTPEQETPVVLRDKPTLEQPAVTGISPAAPAPVIVREKEPEQKPSLLKRLLNVLTGNSDTEAEAEQEKADDKKPAQKKPGRGQSRSSNRSNRGNGERRKPRRRNETTQEEGDSNSAKTESGDNKPSESDESGKPRNGNGRRSRRGGRRRRSRPENAEQAIRQEQEKGNVAPSSNKPEVDGNAIPAPEPEVNGNLVKSDTAPEIDGNKVASSKPRRSRSSSNPRRRRSDSRDKGESIEAKTTQASSDKPANTEAKPESKGVEKKSTSDDNGKEKKPKAKPEVSTTTHAEEQ
jgi:ribonuclease E